MMKEFYNLFQIMKNNPDEKYALATIIHVKGSSYRREGAKMLIGLHGASHGTISGGCLEEDLYYRAVDVIKTSSPKVVTYNLMSEDDLGWGQGAGCNGVIDVYVEPFHWSDSFVSDDITYSLVAKEMEKEKPIISVRKIGSNQHTKTIYYSAEGKQIGKLSEGESYSVEMESFLDNFIHRDLSFESIKLPGYNQMLVFEKYESKERLYIFGAGPDAEPLTELAAKVDFAVTVIDPRSIRCNRNNFRFADSLITEFPSGFFSNYHISPESYVIIMTHNFERDKEILNHLMDTPLKYLGILGPKKRTERLLLPRAVPENIHSPIGLDIDAEGAEEISISILAEMIKIRNNRSNTVRLWEMEGML